MMMTTTTTTTTTMTDAPDQTACPIEAGVALVDPAAGGYTLLSCFLQLSYIIIMPIIMVMMVMVMAMPGRGCRLLW